MEKKYIANRPEQGKHPVKIIDVQGKQLVAAALYGPDGKPVDAQKVPQVHSSPVEIVDVQGKLLRDQPRILMVGGKPTEIVTAGREAIRKYNPPTGVQKADGEYVDYAPHGGFLQDFNRYLEKRRTLLQASPLRCMRQYLEQSGIAPEVTAVLFGQSQSYDLSRPLIPQKVELIYTSASLLLEEKVALSQEEKEAIIILLTNLEKALTGRYAQREGHAYLVLSALRREDNPKLRLMLQHLLTGIIVQTKGMLSGELLEMIGEELRNKDDTCNNLAFLLYIKGVRNLGMAEDAMEYLSAREGEKVGIELEYLSYDLKQEQERTVSGFTEIHEDGGEACFEIASRGKAVALTHYAPLLMDLLRHNWSANFKCWNSLHLHFDAEPNDLSNKWLLFNLLENQNDSDKPDTLETKQNTNPQLQRNVGETVYIDAGQLDIFCLLTQVLAKHAVMKQNYDVDFGAIELRRASGLRGLEVAVWQQLLPPGLPRTCVERLYELGGNILLNYQLVDSYVEQAYVLLPHVIAAGAFKINYQAALLYAAMAERGMITGSNIRQLLTKDIIRQGVAYRIFSESVLSPAVTSGPLSKPYFMELFTPDVMKVALTSEWFSGYVLNTVVWEWLTRDEFHTMFPPEMMEIAVQSTAFVECVLDIAIEIGWYNREEFEQMFTGDVLKQAVGNEEFSDRVLNNVITMGWITREAFFELFTPDVMSNGVTSDDFSRVMLYHAMKEGWIKQSAIRWLFPPQVIRQAVWSGSFCEYVLNIAIDQGIITKRLFRAMFPPDILKEAARSFDFSCYVLSEALYKGLITRDNFSSIFPHSVLMEGVTSDDFCEYLLGEAVQYNAITKDMFRRMFTPEIMARALETEAFREHVLQPALDRGWITYKEADAMIGMPAREESCSLI